MDVSEDTIAYLGKNSIYEPIEGIHRQEENILLFPGDCGSLRFKYEVTEDKIYLENYLENYIGERCDSACCNKLKDFKHNLKIEVDFPQISLNRAYLSPIGLKNDTRLAELVVGIPKHEFDNFYEHKIRLELAGKFATIDQIGTWVEEVKVRTPENMHNRINYRIIADKNIYLESLEPIVEELKKVGIERIFLTCLKENFENEESLFEYVQIDKIDFNKKNITEAIN